MLVAAVRDARPRGGHFREKGAAQLLDDAEVRAAVKQVRRERNGARFAS
jgi:hypothetical protein